MSEWPHARPGASRPARRPDLAGHEAVPPVSVGYGLGGAPLPRIQRGESLACVVICSRRYDGLCISIYSGLHISISNIYTSLKYSCLKTCLFKAAFTDSEPHTLSSF